MQSRLAYSPIVTRPVLRWPSDARLAVWICPNVMYYEYAPEQHASFRWPWTRTPLPDVRGYSLQDYGNRIGFWRMLHSLEQYPIRPTCAVNVSTLTLFPEIRDAMVQRDWTYMVHGFYNTRFLYDYSEADERLFHSRARQAVLQHTGTVPQGALGPGPQSGTSATPDLLAEAGYTYTGDWHHDDQPFPIQTRTGKLISMPYSQGLADSAFFGMGWEADDYVDVLKRQFDQLYDDGAETGRVFCLCLHAYVMAQPHRIRYLDQILDYIFQREGIWPATADEIADYYISNYFDAVQSSVM